MSSLLNINTKLEAFKLINDPTKLLSLLYSKYGDKKIFILLLLIKFYMIKILNLI